VNLFLGVLQVIVAACLHLESGWRIYLIGFVLASLTKSECPVSQTGVSSFVSSNSTASFVKFQNHLFAPLYATSRDFHIMLSLPIIFDNFKIN
jgi:hypothetical protein